MDGKGTEKACTLLSLTSSQSLHVDGPSEVREKGEVADLDQLVVCDVGRFISSLRDRWPGYMHVKCKLFFASVSRV
jgi:hypothetical protein